MSNNESCDYLVQSVQARESSDSVVAIFHLSLKELHLLYLGDYARHSLVKFALTKSTLLLRRYASTNLYYASRNLYMQIIDTCVNFPILSLVTPKNVNYSY